MGNRLNRINIDLGQYKQPWVDYCRARNESPSALFRQLAAREMAQVAARPAQVIVSTDKNRKQILLTAEEAAFVAASAHAVGLSDTRWLVSLVRANMSLQPQSGQTDIEALGRSNLALLAIGRNLNQIARTANVGGTLEIAELVPVLMALRVQLTSHIDSVAEVLSANIRRWRPA